MTILVTIKDRIETIRGKMAAAAARVGRDVSNIKLLAVTKTRTIEEILEAVPFVDGIGENKVQEATLKKKYLEKDWGNLCLKKIDWHLIGHLQTNKTRKALALFDTIDSVDSLSLVHSIERIASEGNKIIPILIEINTSDETSKTGAAPDDFPALLDGVLECKHLRLDGLMTIGPLNDNEAQVRASFAMLRTISENAKIRSGLPLPVLSMGMSGDFEWAITEGSTMVRIGTSLFGSRNAK